MAFVDEWLVATVKTLLPDVDVEALRAGGATSLWDALVTRKLADDVELTSAVAARFRLPIADLSQVDPRVRDAVPENLIRRFAVLPLRITDSHLEIATANPFDIDAEKMLAFSSGREVRVFLASPARIREKLEALYAANAQSSQAAEQALGSLLSSMDDSLIEVTQLDDTDAMDDGAGADEASRAPIVRLVDMILADGIASRASDVHIEPVETGVIVRYRIDGVLRQVMKIPRNAGIPLISRIKIMSALDIADRRRPQDGRARVAVNGSPVDLRVSTLPAAHGEKVVIRILNQKSTVLSLDSLGFFEDDRDRIIDLLGNKEGIILVTGPTGSGKTTTLYSCLRKLQEGDINIVTVEDPVEFKLGEKIVQVQVHEKAGLTFSAALRSILRQDPDVVLVGEIRDVETAETAVQASLTGHLVLSTLHTNDAATSVTRLVDMGIETYKLSSALRGVIAQRLIRRICPVCRDIDTAPVPPRLRKYIPEGSTLYKAVGCGECATTGYRGRFSIAEVITMTPEMKRLIAGGGTASQITDGARKAGMGSLFHNGLRHVLQGTSTVEELLRVTDIPAEDEPVAEPPKSAPSAAAPTMAPVSAPMPVVVAPSTSVPASVPSPDLTFDLLDAGLDAAPTSSGHGRGRRILLVEDEDQLRRVMRDLLEREGYVVAEARDGVQAIDECDRMAPDLIMLDLNLPGLDGYGVLQQLRSRKQTQDVPVIVLTAKGDEDNEVRVFELGADDFLTKPFRARALSARLDAVLNRRRAQ